MTWNAQRLLERARALEPQITAWRREIHMHPELGFQETRTAGLVANVLRDLGYAVTSGVGGTGVVGSLGQGRPAVGLRADMDALPLTEANEVPYASRVPGAMHACGHDAHVAMLLGAATLFSEMPSRPVGEIRLLFQPSEEVMDEAGKTGAVRMLEAGAVDGLDDILALHVHGGITPGKIGVAPGYAMAAGDVFEATIVGAGCHDIQAHQGVDPIYILALVLNAIYGIRSRRIDPLQLATISVGAVHGGERANVIPGEVKIKGSIRSFDDGIRQQVAQELERALGVARALGGDYRLQIRQGVPSLYNDPSVVDAFRQAAEELLGADALSPLPPAMYVEDLAYMVRRVPGALAVLGAQRGAQARPFHSPTFDLDESALPTGAALLVQTACRLLRNSRQG